MRMVATSSGENVNFAERELEHLKTVYFDSCFLNVKFEFAKIYQSALWEGALWKRDNLHEMVSKLQTSYRMREISKAGFTE